VSAVTGLTAICSPANLNTSISCITIGGQLIATPSYSGSPGQGTGYAFFSVFGFAAEKIEALKVDGHAIAINLGHNDSSSVGDGTLTEV
jgi:hypothetical protein